MAGYAFLGGGVGDLRKRAYIQHSGKLNRKKGERSKNKKKRKKKEDVKKKAKKKGTLCVEELRCVGC